MSALTPEAIGAAAVRIAPYVLRTPLLPSRPLSELLGTHVSLKYELFQETGSFKPRGAFNRILSLSAAERERGLVAVSGGNHGKAVAFAAARLGLRARVLMPEAAARSAVDFVRASGAELELFPTAAAAFARARALADDGATFIHPYGDQDVLLGQATLGREILADAPDLTDVIASIGGGGMIGGVAAAIKPALPHARIWGVEPAGADAMRQALAAGQIVQLSQLSSVIATLAPPSVGELALRLAQQYLEELIVLPDAAAVADLDWLLEHCKVLVEPAAAICLSAARTLRGRLGAHVVIILCGAGITLSELEALRARFPTP